MNHLKDLADVVQGVIKAGQIGRPVFARCLLGAPHDRERQATLFVDAIMTVRSWMDDAIDRLIAVGSWGPGLSILVIFRSGASCLISAAEPVEGRASLIVLGNHGAIYRDESSGVPVPLSKPVPESETKRAVRAALEATVETGIPQPVMERDR